MARRLVLHIGAHKTGTTSLQRFLARNRRKLADAGISYPAKMPDGVNLHNYLYFDREGPICTGFRVHVPNLVKLLKEAPGELVIGSSENFSFLFDPEEIQRLAEGLRSVFDDISIVCYLRRQDRHAISHHQEGAKPFRLAESLLWGQSARALPDMGQTQALYLDYNRRLSHWADSFGDKAMCVRIFEAEELEQGDVIADFLALLDLSHLELEPVTPLNVSLGLVAAKVGHIMNAASLRGTFCQKILERLPTSPRQKPARAEAEHFYAAYRESNALLNRRFNISEKPELFDEDFADYPFEAAEEWSEDSANTALEAILRGSAELLDDVLALTPNDLRDASVALENSKPELAFKLMRAAHAMQPKGPFIKAKLEELRERLAAGKELKKP